MATTNGSLQPLIHKAHTDQKRNRGLHSTKCFEDTKQLNFKNDYEFLSH